MKAFPSCLILLFISLPHASSKYEVPMKKAEKPKMDPIPTLPVVTERVYLDIEMDGVSLGRIVFGLFGSVAPKAVENFTALSKCNKGKGKYTDKDLCYKGTTLFRIIPNFGIQGGDISKDDGTGGESIFGGFFEDESFEVKHNRRYMLSSVNAGKKNSNGSQFFINTVKTQWLDGRYEIFGMVLEGLSVITKVEQRGTYGGEPKSKIIISDAGTLPLEEDDHKPRLVSQKLTK